MGDGPGGYATIPGTEEKALGLRLWDPRSGKQSASFEWNVFVPVLSFDQTGKILVAGSYNSQIKLFDVETKKERAVLKGHGKPLCCLAVHPNGKIVASGAEDATIKLWDAESGKELAKLKGHKERVLRCVFSKDGKTLYSTGDDGTIRLWDVPTRAHLQTIKAAESIISQLVLSPDGKLLVSYSNDRRPEALKVWQVQPR